MVNSWSGVLYSCDPDIHIYCYGRQAVKRMESPYYEMTHDFEEENRLFQSGYIKGYHDAMIKGTQEAVEPKQVDLHGKDEWYGLVCVCPDCKAEWMGDKFDTHFCPSCGRSVKWE